MEHLKRKRSENWIESDRTLLKNLIRKRLKEIENKNTDNCTNLIKKKAWEDVARSFNNFCTGGQRTVIQLKSQWVATKIAAKKRFSDNRKEPPRTRCCSEPSEPPACMDSNEMDSNSTFNETISGFESDAVDKKTFYEIIMEPQADVLDTEYEKNNTSIKSKPNDKKDSSLKLIEFDMKCRAELHELQMQVERKKLEVEEKKIRNLDREHQLMEEKFKLYKNKYLDN